MVLFDNQSIGATSFVWFVDDITVSSEEDLSFEFPGLLGSEYAVCLVASISPACADTSCRTIEVEDGPNVYVPNAFSPDGDGINDVFMPIVVGVDPERYRFDIFDRWGQPLYSTTDTKGYWDGNFSNGTEVPIGVYIWKLTAKDPRSGARFERTGHVTLVR
jgi:gliding motility-associated-like protein